MVAGETLAPAQMLGIALVLTGILVGQWTPRGSRALRSAPGAA